MHYPTSSVLIEFLILAMVNQEDAYGYQISQTIKLLAPNIKESTLYPILKKLEKAGFLTTYANPHQGRQRKYYQMTDSGRHHLLFLEEAWTEYKTIVDGIKEGSLRG